MHPRHTIARTAFAVFSILVLSSFNTISAAPTVAAHSKLSMDADKAPPEDKVYEVTPGERAGYRWVEGFWGWNGKEHVWQSGHWIKERPGHVWVADTWAQRGNKWHLYPGHWEKEAVADNETETTEDIGEAPAFDLVDERPEHVPAAKTTAPTPKKAHAKAKPKHTAGARMIRHR